VRKRNKTGLVLSGGDFRGSFLLAGVGAVLTNHDLRRSVEVNLSVSSISVPDALNSIRVKGYPESPQDDMTTPGDEIGLVMSAQETSSLPAAIRHIR
jgi:hypothetical protein